MFSLNAVMLSRVAQQRGGGKMPSSHGEKWASFFGLVEFKGARFPQKKETRTTLATLGGRWRTVVMGKHQGAKVRKH